MFYFFIRVKSVNFTTNGLSLASLICIVSSFLLSLRFSGCQLFRQIITDNLFLQ
jgi:hypothetical protein